jgi:hypothetical protein
LTKARILTVVRDHAAAKNVDLSDIDDSRLLAMNLLEIATEIEMRANPPVDGVMTAITDWESFKKAATNGELIATVKDYEIIGYQKKEKT